MVDGLKQRDLGTALPLKIRYISESYVLVASIVFLASPCLIHINSSQLKLIHMKPAITSQL